MGQFSKVPKFAPASSVTTKSMALVKRNA
jgi:hypothetical protein